MTTPQAKETSEKTNKETNSMRKIFVSKITLNMGAGKDEDHLKRGLRLLERITQQKPVQTVAKKRIPSWGLRPGLAIGCKVTVRENTEELLKRLLAAKEMKLSPTNFDRQGNFSFGIPEYIDIGGMQYDPELKILGLEVAITLERPGFRIKRRKIRNSSVGKNQQISKKEAMAFVRTLGVEIPSEEE